VIRAATDVGGTFTDLVFFTVDEGSGAQRVQTAKVDTTPPDFERGVLNVLHKAGLQPAEVAFMAHGTTVVINAITERKGVSVGLVTTEGFRDVLEIGRGNRPDFFNLEWPKPQPLVPRHLRRELPGRLTQLGEERVPLDTSPVAEIVADFQAQGVEAVAVCLLNAYADPRHEVAAVAAIRAAWPEVAIVASHEITREWREYERTSTAVLSAYVQPPTERYLTRLADRIQEEGFDGQLSIMQSNCGVDSPERSRRVPITMVESGPASGVWGAAELGRLIGEPNVLALDIGGTTAKCSLVRDGTVSVLTDYWIERDARSAGYPAMIPVVDLVEIGQGGGSIAWVDEFRRLHVGPRSAGAVPGPAAYGRGGTEATTTDANLALGRINAGYFVGGEVQADMDAVERALDDIAQGMGVSRVEAARGIVRIADHNMVNALKLVSVNRGHDPRDSTLVAFGGGGGMHAASLAAELGMRRVVIPFAADVFAAWGMLMSDLRRDVFLTRVERFEPESAAAAAEAVMAAEGTAREQFAGEGLRDSIELARHLKLRYENQEHSVEVPMGGGDVTAELIAETIASFHERYEREYTYRLDAPVELVGVHVVATAAVGKLEPAPRPSTGRSLEDAVKGQRDVDYAPEGVHRATILDGALLEPGMRGDGPAVIETAGTTIVVRPVDAYSIDDYGNVHLAIGGRR
jgi:N-methylhydantoinase A